MADIPEISLKEKIESLVHSRGKKKVTIEEALAKVYIVKGYCYPYSGAKGIERTKCEAKVDLPYCLKDKKIKVVLAEPENNAI